MTHEHNALNRLKQVHRKSNNQLLVTYWYDALGRRIKRTVADLGDGKGGIEGNVPAGSTIFLYAGDQRGRK